MKLDLGIVLVVLAPFGFAERASAQVSSEPTKPRKELVLQADRIEMWRCLREFQHRLAEQGPIADAARMVAVHRSVDAAIRPWWFGHGQADLGKLAEVSRSLRKTPEPEPETVARSLEVRPNPLVAIQGGSATKLSIKSLYPARWSGPQSLELVVRATSKSGATLESTPFRIDPGEKLAVQAEVEFPAVPKSDEAKSLEAGVWTLELVARGGNAEPVEAGVAWIVPSSLDLLRTANEAKLVELETKVAEHHNASLSSAHTTLVARNQLLTDRPDRNDSAQFGLDPIAHAAALEHEMQQLGKGIDPYRLRVGDTWRIIPSKVEGKPAAVHVYAPSVTTAKKPMPLLIVLGSIGSDENTVLDLMTPRLRALAEQRGFVVAAMRTSREIINDRRFDALFAELADDFPIDPKRVYFLGHSAGASQLGRLLAPRGERIAACMSAGGADIRYQERHVPVLALAGGADEVDTVEKLQLKAAKYRDETSAVVFKPVENVGWYLLLDSTLESDLDWLLERTLP